MRVGPTAQEIGHSLMLPWPYNSSVLSLSLTNPCLFTQRGLSGYCLFDIHLSKPIPVISVIFCLHCCRLSLIEQLSIKWGVSIIIQPLWRNPRHSQGESLV